MLMASDPLPHAAFPLLLRYAASRAGSSALSAPGDCPPVISSLNRTHPEASFSYTRVLWWLGLLTGQAVVSVAPHLEDGARSWMKDRAPAGRVPDDSEAAELLAHLRGLSTSSVVTPARIIRHQIYACDASCLSPIRPVALPASLVRITISGLTYAEGLWPPEQCLPDGAAFGIMHSDRIVAVAYAHKTERMEHDVADMAVTTAQDFRRRGYGHAVVHAVTSMYTARGGEAWYECSPRNTASQRLAQSVGYRLWAETLSLASDN